MSEVDDLKAEIEELKARVAGLEDLVASASEWLRGYADYTGSSSPGRMPPQILRGSEAFTDRQKSILKAITR